MLHFKIHLLHRAERRLNCRRVIGLHTGRTIADLRENELKLTFRSGFRPALVFELNAEPESVKRLFSNWSSSSRLTERMSTSTSQRAAIVLAVSTALDGADREGRLRIARRIKISDHIECASHGVNGEGTIP